MKERIMSLNIWLMKTTLNQRIVLGICIVLLLAGVGLGIYQLTLKDDSSPANIGNDKQNAIVQPIEETKVSADQLSNTPAEKTPVTTAPVIEAQAPVVSNTTTVETPPQDYYIADDGAHYESEPVYEETTVTEPTYQEPAAASGGGEVFNGNLGNGYKWDATGGADYGTGISN